MSFILKLKSLDQSYEEFSNRNLKYPYRVNWGKYSQMYNKDVPLFYYCLASFTSLLFNTLTSCIFLFLQDSYLANDAHESTISAGDKATKNDFTDIQQHVISLPNWFNNNHFKLNPSNFHVLLFNGKEYGQTHLNYECIIKKYIYLLVN